LKNRIQAFGTHLLGSLVVACFCLALIFGLWYRGPLAAASGVGAIVLILLAVDVMVGPVITFIVFDPRKKELKWDLAIVVAVQLAALAYGMRTVFVARPAYVVFAADRFDVVYANDLTAEKLAKAPDPQFASVPLWGPKVIAARRPESAKERSDIMFGALAGGDDVPQLPQYYATLADQREHVLKRLRPLEELRQFNPARQEEVADLMARHANRSGGVAYLPVHGKVGDFTAVLGKQSGELVEFSSLAPWQ
jgi:hypothetical protein